MQVRAPTADVLLLHLMSLGIHWLLTCTTLLCLEHPSRFRAVFSLHLGDTVNVLIIFLRLIQTMQESADAGAARTVVCAPARTLFLHAVHGISDVKRFLERCKTRRTALTSATTPNGLEEGRVKR